MNDGRNLSETPRNCNRTQQCSILEVWAANVWAVVGRVGNAAWVGEGRDGNTERRSDTRSTVLEPLEVLGPLHSLTGNGVGGVGRWGREGG